jgi:diaminopimelate decarboxylase
MMDADLPAYVFDLDRLDAQLAGIRAALPANIELYYAAKANPLSPVLATVARHVDGFEVASGGELAHVTALHPDRPIAFGGPGKTRAELLAAIRTPNLVIHVESVHELRILAAESERLETDVDLLLRVNPPIPVAAGPGGPALQMGGQPSPFGLDPDQAELCLPLLRSAPRLRLRGLHAHLASGLNAAEHLALSAAVLDWADGWAARHRLELTEVTLGGGMAVDYSDPESRFSWSEFGTGLALLAGQHPGYRLRIEPGRALTAYAGWYAAEVIDVRPAHGAWFAVLAGGTHHLRTPAARGHDQPFDVISNELWPFPWPRPVLGADRVTLVGSLCTPRDVLARDRPVPALRAGDVIAFGLAGAYGWNISHHDFLMHPPPSFHFLGGQEAGRELTGRIGPITAL